MTAKAPRALTASPARYCARASCIRLQLGEPCQAPLRTDVNPQLSVVDVLDLLAIVRVTLRADLQPRLAAYSATLLLGSLIAVEPDTVAGHVVHGPQDEQIHGGPVMPEHLEIAAGLSLERAVAGTFPIGRFQRLGHFLHLVHDDLPFLRLGNAAGRIRMQPVEPRVRLILRTHRIVALAVRSHAACDKARYVRDGRAGQQTLGQPPRLFTVGGGPAATGALADRGQIRSR